MTLLLLRVGGAGAAKLASNVKVLGAKEVFALLELDPITPAAIKSSKI